MAETQGRNVLVQGRIVWVCGDLFKGKQKTVFGTQQVMLDANGQPIMEYGFGLAVPKSVLQQAGAGLPGEIWSAIHEEALQLYPSRNVPKDFAYKYRDGDDPNEGGKEGYAGHLIFACTTRLPIKFFRYENGQNILINEGIKCGDYVNVQLLVKAQSSAKPGLYLNPLAVQFLGYGKEIVNAPSGNSIFGTQPPPLPPGASATPVAPQAGLLVPPPGAPAQAPAAPAYGTPTPGAPAPYGAAPQHPQTAPVMPPPNYGVLPPQYQGQAPAAQPPQMPAPNGAQAGYAPPVTAMPPMPYPPVHQ